LIRAYFSSCDSLWNHHSLTCFVTQREGERERERDGDSEVQKSAVQIEQGKRPIRLSLSLSLSGERISLLHTSNIIHICACANASLDLNKLWSNRQRRHFPSLSFLPISLLSLLATFLQTISVHRF
jgi:hypothetical protein